MGKDYFIIMAKKIYIGNLSFHTTEDTLQNTFSEFGQVVSVSIIKDRMTEQSKGFGFVEMENEEDAAKAISALNGKELDGRRVRVNEAEERKPRSFDHGDRGERREGGYRNNYRNGGRNNYRNNRNDKPADTGADGQY